MLDKINNKSCYSKSYFFIRYDTKSIKTSNEDTHYGYITRLKYFLHRGLVRILI